MYLRRDRFHSTGQSNLDFKAKEDLTYAAKTKAMQNRLELLSTAKSKKFDEILKQKMVKTAPQPLEETKTFYESTGKDPKEKTKIGYPRTFQLEEKDKRKMAFTGESELVYDKHLEKYRDHSFKPSTEKTSGQRKEQLAKDKHDEHAMAQQETQLIGLDKYTLETLKNNVDLEKIREIRRALRRRYAARKNIQKIYNTWDTEHTGHITVENVYKMIKNLGLNMNVDEARVLVASADRDGDAKLSLDEFLDLIYNKDDALNVNMEAIAKSMGGGNEFILQKEALEKGNGNLIKKLEEDAKRGREIRHLNQMNLLLKNRLNELAMSFLNDDPNRAGYINYEKFEANIKKLGINENILTERDIKELFSKHKSDEHTIDYKNFVSVLKDFKFVHEDAYKDMAPNQSHRSSHQALPEAVRAGLERRPDPIHVVDCRTIPYNQLVNYLEKKDRVGRALKRFFPNQDSFKEYLSEALKLDKEQINSRPVSKKELKDIVTKLFTSFEKVNLSKLDYEGFLSSFLFNKHGYTNLKDVTYSIYEESDKEYFDRISLKKNGTAPHRQLASLDAVEPSTDRENEQTLSTEGNELYNTRTKMPAPQFFATSQGFSKPRNLNTILQAIDDRLFAGSVKAYNVYKTFDVDHDGFVSHKDITKKMEELSVIPKDEIPTLLNYLDPENKGFVNFKEFHSKIRSNMAQQDQQGQSTVLPYVVPSKKITQKIAQDLPETKKRVEELTKGFEVTTYDLKPATRYGSSPVWKNTFITFQASSHSPMFISEHERFNRHPLMSTMFQTEEKERKLAADISRLDAKRTHNDFFTNKINQTNLITEIRDKNKLYSKNMAQSIYEHKAKLLNPI